MATLTIPRQGRQAGRTDSPSIQSSVGEKLVSITSNLADADLNNPAKEWQMEIWESADGVNWKFACRNVDRGGVNRSARAQPQSVIRLHEALVPGRFYRASIVLSEAMDFGLTIQTG